MSIRDLLDLLARNDGVRFIHRSIGTAEDLVHYLNRWNDRRYRHFRIGYVAFHGHRGRLQLRRGGVPISLIAQKAEHS